MIKGIGIDLVDIDRFAETLERDEGSFVKKIFTDNETAYCKSKPNPVQHFAARFAAKEALAKAVKTGWSGVFRWKDVEVVNDPAGAPDVILHNELKDALKNASVHLSISHSDTAVTAVVVIELP